MGIKTTATQFNNKLRNKEEPTSVFPEKNKSPVQPENMGEAIKARLVELNEQNRALIKQEFAKQRAYLEATLSPEDFSFLEKGGKYGNA